MLVKDNIFWRPSARFRPTSNLHQLRISRWFSNNTDRRPPAKSDNAGAAIHSPQIAAIQ